MMAKKDWRFCLFHALMSGFPVFRPAGSTPRNLLHIQVVKDFTHFLLIFLKHFFNLAHYMLGNAILPR